MKTISALLLGLSITSAFAGVDTEKLAGKWKSSCSQMQIDDKQGHVVEVYAIKHPDTFEFERRWYKDAYCEKLFSTQSEKGVFKVGKENTNNGFNPAGTYEVVYKSTARASSDKGLIWVDADYKKLRLSRGMGNVQNTMLSLFVFTKE